MLIEEAKDNMVPHLLPEQLGENITKSFNNSVFKLNIPKINYLSTGIEFTTTLTFRVSDPAITIALYRCICIDRKGKKISKQYEDKYLERGTGSAMHKITYQIPYDNTEFIVPNNKIIIQILSTEEAVYQVEYIVDAQKNVEFVGVSKAQLTSDMREKLKNISLGFQNSNAEACEDVDNSAENCKMCDIPELQRYKEALVREKFFLQRDGGRKYKVTDGKKLNIQRGLVSYVFDMESELFLSDDAPITLKVGVKEAVGSVLVCEGFSITIIVDKDLGETISSAILSVEPWKLLEAQVNKLDSITSRDRIAYKLIKDGPRLVLDTSIKEILKGQDAVKKKIGYSDITVVWGPPGTGKSYTMANIAIDCLKKNGTVLMVSHSNISVDGVVKQIITQLEKEQKTDLLTKGNILRYGYVRDENLAENRDAVAFNYALDRNET